MRSTKRKNLKEVKSCHFCCHESKATSEATDNKIGFVARPKGVKVLTL